jgi:hypothetical protein
MSTSLSAYLTLESLDLDAPLRALIMVYGHALSIRNPAAQKSTSERTQLLVRSWPRSPSKVLPTATMRLVSEQLVQTYRANLTLSS